LELELESKGREKLRDLVREVSRLANIHYIRQKEQKGIGYAICCAKAFVGNDSFAVLLGDYIVNSKTPCIKQLIDCYNEYRTTIAGVQKVPKSEVNKYSIINGVCIEDRVYKIKNLVEKPGNED
jgi:UTP--glucose-1-phosphate uridylyltransferase